VNKCHPHESEALEFTRAFTTNDKGQRVLAGLTLGETDEYFAYVDLRSSGSHDPAALNRQLELAERHEPARLAIVVAEADRRNPMKN
jgi:hypothetical protein